MSDMPRDFWLERWNIGQIGFHQAAVNPRLSSFWPGLGLPEGSGVFVPLCGKTLDMHYLAEQGHRVVGVEFSEIGVRAFFDEAGIVYQKNDSGSLPCFEGGAFRLFCGDFFELGSQDLGEVAAVYDRAALIALPPNTRPRYAAHLQSIVPNASDMLVLTIEYDQNAVGGPPFCVTADELGSLYAESWKIETLAVDERPTMPPKFADVKATESVHRLHASG
jgi:thiopurine S-methyltransferase